MQPVGLHETRLFELSDETSGFKMYSFNPKCNQGLEESWWFHATKLVAFRIERVNFDAAGGITVTQLFFWLMVGPCRICNFNLKFPPLPLPTGEDAAGRDQAGGEGEAGQVQEAGGREGGHQGGHQGKGQWGTYYWGPRVGNWQL